MTFCYQNQCEDSCYSPCNYRRVCSYRTYDCSPCTYQTYDCSPCDYRGYRSLCSYQDCYPSYSYSYSSRYRYPYSSCYSRRYNNYGSCYPC